MKTVLLVAFYIRKNHADVWIIHYVYNVVEVNSTSSKNAG